ncbi:hypothetical protein PS623_04666 [Pseudomonas fluorescens]|nr:hypothetical protein PS623_04666 [Pseudomonas fluorescens]
MQYGLEAGQQQHEQRAAGRRRHSAQARAKGYIEFDFMARTAVAAAGRAWPVQWQSQLHVLATESLAPVGQLPLALTGLQPQPLPVGVVGVVHGQRRQRSALAVQGLAITFADFTNQDRQRPGIADNMVAAEQQHMLLGIELDQRCPQQQVTLQIEGLLGQRRHLSGQ